MNSDDLKEYLIDCVLNDTNSDEIIERINQIFENAERYEDLCK